MQEARDALLFTRGWYNFARCLLPVLMMNMEARPRLRQKHHDQGLGPAGSVRM